MTVSPEVLLVSVYPSKLDLIQPDGIEKKTLPDKKFVVKYVRKKSILTTGLYEKRR